MTNKYWNTNYKCYHCPSCGDNSFYFGGLVEHLDLSQCGIDTPSLFILILKEIDKIKDEVELLQAREEDDE